MDNFECIEEVLMIELCGENRRSIGPDGSEVGAFEQL